MFGVVPKVIWNKINPADEHNLCTWAMRCLLIELDERKILIDTGIGDKQGEKFRKHFVPHGEDSLLNSLKELGFGPEDITDVILTHLHFDHVGGAVYRNEAGELLPTFKNAIYWSNRQHWNTATDPNAREKASFLQENILPLQESGQLKFTMEGAEVYKGIHIHYVHGHTDAMMIIRIALPTGNELLYMADLIPSSGHIRLPYVMAYDMQPLKTLGEKEHWLRYAVDNESVLFFEHDPKVECARLKETDRGIAVDQTFPLSELLEQSYRHLT